MRRWHKPVPLQIKWADEVPDTPGVCVLLRRANDISSVLKIGPARSLRRMFQRECRTDYSSLADQPGAMMWMESWSDAEEASRLVGEYRRRHGRVPPLNSPY